MSAALLVFSLNTKKSKTYHQAEILSLAQGTFMVSLRQMEHSWQNIAAMSPVLKLNDKKTTVKS